MNEPTVGVSIRYFLLERIEPVVISAPRSFAESPDCQNKHQFVFVIVFSSSDISSQIGVRYEQPAAAVRRIKCADARI